MGKMDANPWPTDLRSQALSRAPEPRCVHQQTTYEQTNNQ